MARFIPYSSPSALIEPDRETVQGIEAAIRWAEQEVPNNLRKDMVKLCYAMALTNQKFARKLSFGPEDPNAVKSDLAWKLPVRRISGAYYISWKIKPIRDGWMLYNDSREAYFIEFGINWMGQGRRVRRPVRKLSLLQTLRFMQTTQAWHRIWADIYKTRQHVAGFTQIVQSPGGGHIIGWDDISTQTAQNMARASSAPTLIQAGIRSGGRKGFQRAIYNRGGGSYRGPNYGRRLP